MLGHVDHGKTTILDRIRKTSIQKKEAGGITQHIGATEVPKDTILEICRDILQIFPVNLRIPGLLFIDTPGHEAFTNLRRRGGSIADLAVLVVDVNQGFQPQTYEAIEILKAYRTPFVVAANKIDLVPLWKSREGSFLKNLKEQAGEAVDALDERIYRIVGSLYDLGFSSERFDRVKDFTKNVLIFPVSGKTGEGIPELLLYLSGLAQKFLEEKLKTDVKGPGKGVILEVKEVPGIGTALDVILYDGVLKRGDPVVFLGKEGVVESKVRVMLRPAPLSEIRMGKDFIPVGEVHAAAGVRIGGPLMDRALPGSPILVKTEEAMKEIERERQEMVFQGSELGVVVKADTLGSLEAIHRLLDQRGVPVRLSDIGEVSKRDVMEAAAVREKDRYLGAVLAFNVKVSPEAREMAEKTGVPIIEERIIYRLLERYEEWKEEERLRELREIYKKYTPPCSFQLLEGYVFRVSKPAVVGVRVLEGRLRAGVRVMREDGKEVGEVKSIQREGKSVEFAEKGDEVAVAIEGPTVGRQIKEGDVLYTVMSPQEVRVFLESPVVSQEEKELAKKIRRMLRQA